VLSISEFLTKHSIPLITHPAYSLDLDLVTSLFPKPESIKQKREFKKRFQVSVRFKSRSSGVWHHKVLW